MTPSHELMSSYKMQRGKKIGDWLILKKFVIKKKLEMILRDNHARIVASLVWMNLHKLKHLRRTMVLRSSMFSVNQFAIMPHALAFASFAVKLHPGAVTIPTRIVTQK
jgi:hypothetical protein